MCSLAQSCLTLCGPMGCSPPGSIVHEIFQARILQWVAISYSRGSSEPRDRNQVSRVSCIGSQILYHCTTWEAVNSCSVTQLCPTLCDPMDCSTPVFPVLHHLLDPAQTHVHWVSDAIQPPCALLPPFPPAFRLSQYQGLSQWVSFSHQVAKVLELQIQYQSFQWIFRVNFLEVWLVWSPCYQRVFFNTTVWKQQFFGAQPSLWSNPHIHTWLLKKP